MQGVTIKAKPFPPIPLQSKHTVHSLNLSVLDRIIIFLELFLLYKYLPWVLDVLGWHQTMPEMSSSFQKRSPFSLCCCIGSQYLKHTCTLHLLCSSLIIRWLWGNQSYNFWLECKFLRWFLKHIPVWTRNAIILYVDRYHYYSQDSTKCSSTTVMDKVQKTIQIWQLYIFLHYITNKREFRRRRAIKAELGSMKHRLSWGRTRLMYSLVWFLGYIAWRRCLWFQW